MGFYAQAQAEMEAKAQKEKQERENTEKAKKLAAKARSEKYSKLVAEEKGPAEWTHQYAKWDAYDLLEAEEVGEKNGHSHGHGHGHGHGHSHGHSHGGAGNEMDQYRPAFGGCSSWNAKGRARERAVWEMPWEKRLEKCNEFRIEGNMFFREGQFGRAAVRYHHAMTYFEYCIPESEEQEKQLEAMQLPTYLNFSMCMIRMQKFADVHTWCLQAIKIDPQSAKAFYRRAVAFRNQDEFSSAREQLDRALELAPEDAVIQREARILAHSISSYQLNISQVAGNMFDSEESREGGRTAHVRHYDAAEEDQLDHDLAHGARRLFTLGFPDRTKEGLSEIVAGLDTDARAYTFLGGITKATLKDTLSVNHFSPRPAYSEAQTIVGGDLLLEDGIAILESDAAELAAELHQIAERSTGLKDVLAEEKKTNTPQKAAGSSGGITWILTELVEDLRSVSNFWVNLLVK